MASTIPQSMDQISSNTYLELIIQLTSFPVGDNSNSVKNILKSNIQSIYKRVSQNNEFQELFELIRESFTGLAISPNASDDWSSEKIAGLFVEWNLFFLDLYCLSLTKAMRKYRRHIRKNECDPLTVSPPDTLNSIQRKAIGSSIDFVFALAISTQLLPGVGMALNSKSVECLSGFSKSIGSTNVDFMRKSLNAMIDLFESKFTFMFKEYITSHHFNAYLSAIFQIAHCPNYLTKERAGKYRSNDQKVVVECDLKTEEEIQRYREYLSDLIHLSSQKFIFRELMMLIGGCSNGDTAASCQERQTKTPKWLMRSSSHYVRECIMKKDGIESLILSLSDEALDNQVFEGGKPANVNWSKCCMVARIITNCPLCSCPEVEYSSNVLKQIFEIIRSLYYIEEGSEGKGLTVRPQICKSMVPILVKVMDTFSASQPTSFVDHILRKVAGPLFACSSSTVESSVCRKASREVVSAQDFSLCIETLHEIVVIFHYPQSTLSSSLVPFLDVLFRLHVYSSANPTYLSFSVESLIDRIFNNMEPNQVASILKRLSGLEVDESASLRPLLSMNENLEFVPGESGGIRVVLIDRYKRPLSRVDLLDEIEKRVACLVSIISLLKDREAVATEIFLACLRELTCIVSQEIDSENDAVSSVVAIKNFDVEKWGKNILLLTLLSGLVEKFDDLCMTNIGHIFLFSQATMEHSIQVLKKPKSLLTCVTSVDDFQMETLALVIGLLATVIFDCDQISCSTLSEAEKLVSSLRYLSNHHSSSEVRSSAHELVRIIAHQASTNPGDESIYTPSSVVNLESKRSKESCFGISIASQAASSRGDDQKPKASSSLMSSLSFIVRSLTDQEMSKTCSIESLSTLTPIVKTSQKGNFSRSTLVDSLSSDRAGNHVSTASSTSLKGNAESKKSRLSSAMGEPKLLSSIAGRNSKSVHFSSTVHSNEIDARQRPSQKVSDESGLANNATYCDEVNTLLRACGKLSYND